MGPGLARYAPLTKRGGFRASGEKMKNTYEISGCCDGCLEAGVREQGHSQCSNAGHLADLARKGLLVGTELRWSGWIATARMTAREIHESRSTHASARIVGGTRRRRNARRRVNH